jgi:hypothetical protein
MTTLSIEMLEELERMTRSMLVLAKREDWDSVMQQDAERASLLSARTAVKVQAPRANSTADSRRQASNRASIEKPHDTEQHRQKLILSIKKQDARLMAVIHAARDTVAEQGSHHHAQRSAQQHYQTSISL